MPEISDERLDEILAAAEKATPGEWRRATGTANYRIYGQFREVAVAYQVRHHSKAGDLLVEADGRANAEFIALANPATLTTLIAEVKAARAGKGVGAVPQGWALVPRRVTDQMYVAFREELDSHGHIRRFTEAYEAMLAAAPALPSLEPQGAQEVVAWICDGCGRLFKDPDEDFAKLRASGAISCCPERKPIPLFLASPTGNSVHGGVSEEAVEAAARALCVDDGRHDPDELDRMFICDDDNNPLPAWRWYEDAARAALTAASVQQGKATHRHKKRGSEYVVIGYGKIQANRWWELPFGENTKSQLDKPVDMREVAIYRSIDDDSLWVRPREEFEDGRFEVLPTPPSIPGDGR